MPDLKCLSDALVDEKNEIEKPVSDLISAALDKIGCLGPLYANQVAYELKQALQDAEGMLTIAVRLGFIRELPDGRYCTPSQHVEAQEMLQRPKKVAPIRYCNANTGLTYVGVRMGTTRDTG